MRHRREIEGPPNCIGCKVGEEADALFEWMEDSPGPSRIVELYRFYFTVRIPWYPIPAPL